MTVTRSLAIFAALGGALAVTTGAFAAHGTGPEVKLLLTTGAHYQLVHAGLALLCAVWPGRTRWITLAGWLAASGGLIFALALSTVALSGLSVMGAVAPIGGLLMIAAWLMIALAAARARPLQA